MSHWAPHSFGLVPHQSKEFCKLLYVEILGKERIAQLQKKQKITNLQNEGMST